MKSLVNYIQERIDEGVFDIKPVTYKDFVMANKQLELCNIDTNNIQDKATIEKIYFNTDLKLPNGSTVKNQVNSNKALFRKFNLAQYVEGKNSNEMNEFLSKIGKIENEVGDDTYTNNDGTILLRRLETNDINEPMMIIKFKV